MSESQTITIEVDGQELTATPGQMLIEVTDGAGIDLPRFCYHKKLSVSANCRMCLVEVERAPKPLPACATPCSDGMKVKTKSPIALAAQKGTMEFLLINHPLDCPICDQGGECELQDVAIGYGGDTSRYAEKKRVVPAQNFGPLIETNFTRCIHCTRCVRFGAEIAGIREMGAVGRGEHMKIGTYVEKSVDSELSGNIIDVCPVGSLTSKPFMYQARGWEMVQRDTIAPHDSIGSNLHVHLRRNDLLRVHPKNNEVVNECWISDRDRFSYEGLYSDDRLTQPLVKKDGEWNAVSWDVALKAVADGLKQADGSVGALISPSSTVEEAHLAQKLVRGLGSDNIDCRLRQADFRGEEPIAPWLGQSIESLEQLNAALIVGSNVRKEQPLLGHRLRKAALEGAKISYITPFELDLNYRAEQVISTPMGMVNNLAAVAKALGASGALIDSALVKTQHKLIAEHLKEAGNATVLLGNIATAHSDYAVLRSLAAVVAEKSGAVLGYLPEAANSVGARLVGAVPNEGLNAVSMLEEQLKAYILMGVEPGFDFSNPALASKALKGSDFVVALTAFRSDSLESTASVLLPISSFGETSGSFVSSEGRLQSFAGAVTPKGGTRPAWKVLRVVANMLDIDGFDQVSSEEVLAEAKEACEQALDNTIAAGPTGVQTTDGLNRIGDVPIYAIDPLVRRAQSLQKTNDAIGAGVYINSEQAERSGLTEGDTVTVNQNGNQAKLPVVIDLTIPNGAVRIPAGLAGTETLGTQFGEVTLEKV